MPHDFRPLPLLGNPHVQTVLAYLLPGSRGSIAAARYRVALPDGDQLAVYDSIPDRWRPGAPIVVLVHGLGGDHRSPILVRLTRRLLPLGRRVVRLDLRGCGRGVALARRPYHAGSSPDVRAVLDAVHAGCPMSPIWLVGFSLGGNIALKLAGEAAAVPVPGLARVAAIGPPIDLARCVDLIGEPRNRFYEVHFLRDLIALGRQRRRYFPELPLVRFTPTLTLRAFDEQYTAPLAGFRDAADYYRRASSLPLVPRIALPTLILTSRDDPFIAVEPFETLAALANVAVRISPRGGHLGFIGWDGRGGIRWVDRQLVEWLHGGG
jgi:predicted alpha/beta-fold hydrolase